MDSYPGIYNEKAKNPDYSTFKARLETFNDDDDIDFKKALAKCGFYCTGRRDCVSCFFCGGSFRGLPKNENIWFHHAADFSHCEYLKLHKGDKFIEKVLDMTKHDSMDLDEEKDLDCIDSDQMIEDLNSRASQMMMGKEYKQSDVEQAIIKAREIHGYGELKSTQIFKWLLENESINKPSKVYSTSPSTTTYHESPATSGNSKFINTTVLNVESLDPEDRHLIEENRTLKSKMTCKICMDKESCVLFQPCGHMVSCMSCASKLTTCALCRAPIAETFRTYTG